MCPLELDVAALDDLPDGGVQPAQADGKPILLVRAGDTVQGFGGTCPHAGAPLAEGVRNGDRIVCPWHKATFCLRSGAVLEPPAVDDLPRYAVRIVSGRVLVSRPAGGAADAAPQGTGEGPGEEMGQGADRGAEEGKARRVDSRCFVIVGGGAAGAMAAQTLRQSGFNGRVIMLDRENRVPYDRTVLSKYFLSGLPGAEKSPLQSQAFYCDQRIERRTADVVRLDARAHRITCADGSVLDYDKALLATGGIPKRPGLPGANLRNVFMLRTREDADAILRQAERSGKAVVLGASFIGMEVAASLRERGLDVTVVGKAAAPFEKQLGARIGTAFTLLHEARGVAFRLGQGVAALQGNRAVRAVLLEGGESLPADLVVLGFGIRPATDYLDGVAVNADGSVSAGADLQVAEDLYAAGDIARFPLFGDGPPIRVEHWRVAEQHGRVAALNMAGLTTAGRDMARQAARYDVVPVFWTIQYLKRLDYIGHASEWDDVVLHGDLEKPNFLAYYVKDGRVVAAAGLGRDRDTAALIELFNRRRDWAAAELGAQPARLLD